MLLAIKQYFPNLDINSYIIYDGSLERIRYLSGVYFAQFQHKIIEAAEKLFLKPRELTHAQAIETIESLHFIANKIPSQPLLNNLFTLGLKQCGPNKSFVYLLQVLSKKITLNSDVILKPLLNLLDECVAGHLSLDETFGEFECYVKLSRTDERKAVDILIAEEPDLLQKKLSAVLMQVNYRMDKEKFIEAVDCMQQFQPLEKKSNLTIVSSFYFIRSPGIRSLISNYALPMKDETTINYKEKLTHLTKVVDIFGDLHNKFNPQERNKIYQTAICCMIDYLLNTIVHGREKKCALVLLKEYVDEQFKHLDEIVSPPYYQFLFYSFDTLQKKKLQCQQLIEAAVMLMSDIYHSDNAIKVTNTMTQFATDNVQIKDILQQLAVLSVVSNLPGSTFLST